MQSESRNHALRMDAPDLLLCTRFGLRVRDRGWLLHRLSLISSITAPSLAAQSDQRFYWAILVDDGLPDDIRDNLKDVLAPFGNRGFLWNRFHHGPHSLIEAARKRLRVSDSDLLLSGRLDDDDAWSTAMVGAVRNHVGAWLAKPRRHPGLTFTFQDGLEWVMYEMVDVERLMDRDERVVHPPSIRKYSLPFIGTSVFVCSPLAMGGTSMSGSHSKVAANLNAAKGFATEILSTEKPMWLCCRHKQAGSGIRKAQGDEVALGLEDLAHQFGLDAEGVRHYLDHAKEHRYTLLKAPLTKKAELMREWLQTKRQLTHMRSKSADIPRLEEKLEALTDAMAQLENHVLGDPD